MKTICLEEHFATPAFLTGPGKAFEERASRFGDKLLSRLSDLGSGRIAEMDAAGIDVQVLSLTSPGTEQMDVRGAIELARETNEILAEAIASHPARFGAFAVLPTASPREAGTELERVVQQYGFKGTLINGHIQGRYLDDQFFWPIFECAEALRVPIYLHPTPPPQAVIDASYSGFSPMLSEMLAGPGWGWHIETAVHVLRIILGGTFDRFPKLQMVVGHMGETLPFMLQRVDVMPMQMTKLRKPISAYLRENLHYTFGGFNFTPTFLDLLLEVGIDRIMFSTDHPFGSMTEGRAFLDRLPVSPADREQIAHGNAEKLLGM